MKVSIAVVALNEAEYLPSLLEDIVAQDYEHKDIEVLLIDSGSTDETVRVMKKFRQENSDNFGSISILENRCKILAAGCNIAIKNFTGDTLVRIDAHAHIPSNFISKNVTNIKAGEKISGGKRPNITQGKSTWGKILLAAESATFGSSFANFRNSTKKQYVKSMFHVMYSREVLEAVGYFNESLGRTEDNEFNYRVRVAGYRFCYDPEIISYQFIRPTLTKMLKQKFANGFWIGRTAFICPECLSIFYYVPMLFLLASVCAVIISCCCGYPMLLYCILGPYISLMVAVAILACRDNYWNPCFLLVSVLCFCIHISYGVGTIVGGLVQIIVDILGDKIPLDDI